MDSQPFQMQAVSMEDPTVRDLPCSPMDFGSWQGEGEERTYLPDPNVYMFAGRLYGHPATLHKHGLT